MATYTVEAFKWTGTGYNATYTTSYTAVITDNDRRMQGARDTNESVSIDGGPALATQDRPPAINVSFTDTSGQTHVETFYFFMVGNEWYFVPAPGSAFTVGATLGSYQNHTTRWRYSSIICFGRGTFIETDDGPVPVEMLEPGAQIALAGGGFASLRLNLRSSVDVEQMGNHETLKPVRICAGALGAGLPLRDLLVSRQHRLLVQSPIAKRMFGRGNVLVAAIRLIDLPGIYLDEREDGLDYHHLVFDRHQVIIAEGAPTESFFTGREAIAALDPEARGEVLTLFPQLARKSRMMRPAVPIPERVMQKRLIARHLRNAKPILSVVRAEDDGSADLLEMA